MKKHAALLIAALVAAVAVLVGLAGPASANHGGPGGHGGGPGGGGVIDLPNDEMPDADNKKVTLCHATESETNPYNKIEVSVRAFYQSGHISHADDIWEAFSYTDNRGNIVSVPARGDTDLLAFADCKAPPVDEKIAKPEAVYFDKCGTADDVFSVAPGRGYTVGAVQTDGVIQVINVTLAEGFTWLDGSTGAIRFEKPVFTNVDCDLPETGLGATFNTTGGFMALGALALGAVMLVTGGRRKATSSI